MKLLKILFLTFIINTSYALDTQELFQYFHTPLIRAMSDFVDAGIVYHHKTKNFESNYYTSVFYGTAAVLTLQHFAQHNYTIDALAWGSLKGAVSGWIATYATWPFYPFVSIGTFAYYKSNVRKKMCTIKELINITDDIAVLNAAYNYLPTYQEGSWLTEQKEQIRSCITMRLQEVQLNNMQHTPIVF